MVVSIQFSQLRKSMKKQFYIAIAAPVLALSLFTSCSKEEEDIFDDSAANRLSTAKTEIASRLTADGGKWVMEYFCNESEPGYLFVMTFKPSGAVEIAADHKWIGNTYRAETSLWEMIADSGPVLSFNSYNEVFHIFSSPEDITGPDAPTNPDRPDENGNPSDINETGYGHNGDYEFVVMEGDSDHDNMRLLSKKRGYNIYMHRLSADTDPQAYLAENKAVADNIFSEKFPTQVLVDGSTGERFVVNKAASGVMEVYPEAGDAVTQTVKHNYIATADGIRFSSPFSIPRADEAADHYVIESFAIQADGSLKAADGSLMTTPVLPSFMRTDLDWAIDVKDMGGEFKARYETLVEDWYLGTNKIRRLTAIYFMNIGQTTPKIRFQETMGGVLPEFDSQQSMTANGNLAFAISPESATPNGLTRYNKVASLPAFIDYLNQTEFIPVASSLLSPSRIKFVNKADADSYFVVTIR